MNQGTLFDDTRPNYRPPAARRDDPETSHEAAKVTKATQRKYELILDLLDDGEPLTHGQMLAHFKSLGIKFTDSGLRGCVARLKDAGKVRASGRFGLTPSGNRSIKWECA